MYLNLIYTPVYTVFDPLHIMAYQRLFPSSESQCNNIITITVHCQIRDHFT